ncbi:MAG: beta-propeller domain-containing protein [Patescibacteria group bacterium]|jgi:uncharacterized secreted protein with C-terminal beta-propeller domain
MFKSKSFFLLIALLALGLLVGGIALIGYFYNESGNLALFTSHKNLKQVEAFNTEAEFLTYLSSANELSSFGSISGLSGIARNKMIEDVSMLSTEEASLTDTSAVVSERSSETNVQVQGIDEPDTVKTNGQEIFLSTMENNWYFDMPIDALSVDSSMPTSYTKNFNALPPEELAMNSEIKEGGELLLSDDNLIIFASNKIFGYDIKNPAKMEKIWEMKIDERSSYYTARLLNGKIYLITKTNIDDYNPCPIKPLTIEDKAVEIACTEIYHPLTSVPTDATYNIMAVDPATGAVNDKISFVGSYNNSVVYMSPNYLYVTFTYPGDMVELMYSFLTEDGKDLFPQIVIDDLRKLRGYDISQEPKMMELSVIMDNYLNTLPEDERLKLENDMENKLQTYLEKRKRDIERTAITKVNIDDLAVEKTGEIPGKPLNQFSLDEYEDNLRMAVTVGEDMMFDSNSANDLYVLNNDLEQIGSVLDLGVGERIYSARFVGEKGYVVTFKETDPFYVLDLKDAANPQKVGELKIPGYSSYLHPLNEDLILGVGKEENKVKLSLFDVSDAANPEELAKYSMNDYWSDVLNTHHAFLQDSAHEIFFMPGAEGGYVFSYAGNTLELKKTIAGFAISRAIYINDYLYIIGQNKIVVLDENTFEEVKSLEF